MANLYYIHDGDIQKGPFTLDELKALPLSMDTPVWHEGMTEWTVAANIEEIRAWLHKTPPPFKPSIKTPNLTSKNQKEAQTKKRSAWFWLVMICVFLGFGSILAAGVVLVKYRHRLPGLKVDFNPPSPVVITSRTDDAGSTLFDAKATVYATIQNNGGDGNVLIFFDLYQNGEHYQKMMSAFMKANQVREVYATFSEVKLLGGGVSHDVRAKAQ